MADFSSLDIMLRSSYTKAQNLLHSPEIPHWLHFHRTVWKSAIWDHQSVVNKWDVKPKLKSSMDFNLSGCRHGVKDKGAAPQWQTSAAQILQSKFQDRNPANQISHSNLTNCVSWSQAFHQVGIRVLPKGLQYLKQIRLRHEEKQLSTSPPSFSQFLRRHQWKSGRLWGLLLAARDSDLKLGPSRTPISSHSPPPPRKITQL